MGNWGTESCSNDSCWDCLCAKNIHKMTQKECNYSINKLWEEGASQKMESRKATLNYFNSNKLGVVIWVLHLGKRVSIKKLKEVLLIAKKESDPNYIRADGWRNPNERAASLKEEIIMIEFAIANKGVGEKKQIKGLLEKAVDFLTGK